ncbi:glycosyltransferase family A protein [Pseudoalteromonas maricaloris]
MRNILVLVPFYNNKDDLMASLLSIKEDIEIDILVVDDGSQIAFESSQVVELLPANCNLKSLRLSSNKGITAALNFGLRWAYEQEYEFIARLDAGDLCAPNRLEKQCDFLKVNKNVGIVGSWVQFVNEMGKTFSY